MNWILTLITIVSIVLVILILLQKTNTDGAGLGGGDSFGINSKKRGLEKTIFQATIFVSVIFVGLNLLSLFLK
jgi:protein translocase SecG subunit